ncbi:hypothetical protein E5288_WYG012238 [Bos mutus]|uniref:Uncharacterized protein n=1 Tax=Bos mutus TaxID=72004 RepID=A0A6B0RNG0_9CETA|nr:hypothetical protein [Bos mutus]
MSFYKFTCGDVIPYPLSWTDSVLSIIPRTLLKDILVTSPKFKYPQGGAEAEVGAERRRVWTGKGNGTGRGDVDFAGSGLHCDIIKRKFISSNSNKQCLCVGISTNSCNWYLLDTLSDSLLTHCHLVERGLRTAFHSLMLPVS